MKDRLEREAAFHDIAFTDRRRSKLRMFYAAANIGRLEYQSTLHSDKSNIKVLEYGCGPGSEAFHLAECGHEVTGIDISEVAIQQAKADAIEKSLKINFEVMDAEALMSPDSSYDLICGTGILHHLDLKRAYSEIARTMKPNGKAIFLEPLGHNPVINLFRKRTPDLRTTDEHPLKMSDIELAKEYFGNVVLKPFCLLTVLAAPFYCLPGFTFSLRILDYIDRGIFRVFPKMGRYAWQGLLEFDNPNRQQSHTMESNILTSE